MDIVGLIPIVPDLVIELRSATDSLSTMKTKMEQYQRVGVQLGLLVDPKNKQVTIYKPGHDPEVLEDPKLIDCNQVMPGFMLDMSKVW